MLCDCLTRAPDHGKVGRWRPLATGRGQGLADPGEAARRGRKAHAGRGLRRGHVPPGRAGSRHQFAARPLLLRVDGRPLPRGVPARRRGGLRRVRASDRRATDPPHDLELVAALGPGSKFNLEFVALANHRKAIRAEMASYAERFRSMQLDAITAILAARTVSTARRDDARSRSRRDGRRRAVDRARARARCQRWTRVRRSRSSSSTSTKRAENTRSSSNIRIALPRRILYLCSSLMPSSMLSQYSFELGHVVSVCG